jgi:hypothetical protein
MGFLSLFSKSSPTLLRLPSGSFTMDRDGRVLVSTLSSSFPTDWIHEMGNAILEAFRDAHAAQLPLDQLIIRYGSLKVSAREMRGGTIVFLSPQTLTTPADKP